MKIIKDDFNKTIYPPVKIKCPHCDSIIIIENGDAYLNKHYVWNWNCQGELEPCFEFLPKKGSKFNKVKIMIANNNDKNIRGKRAKFAIDDDLNIDSSLINEILEGFKEK